MSNHILNQIKYIENNYQLFRNKTAKKALRHNFFANIETEILAYLLGLLMSDGSVNSKNHQIKLHINEKDRELFDYLRIISPEAGEYTLRGYTSNAITPDGRQVTNKGSVALYINSEILVKDLAKYGVIDNKTYTQLHIPKIPKDLIRHFIRGYFDGDGCITYSILKPNPKNREINYKLRANFEICGKLNGIFLEMLEWFARNGIETSVIYIKRNDMYRLLTTARKKLINIYHLLYDDSNFYLSRKFNKFDHYVNTEVTQLIAEYRNALEVNVNESNNPPKSVGHPTLLDENVR